MPGVGTHTTIIQRLAMAAVGDPNVRTFLGDPDLNADWLTYTTVPEALQGRYAVLGAEGAVGAGDVVRAGVALHPAGVHRGIGGAVPVPCR